jgi:hypothetical protein
MQSEARAHFNMLLHRICCCFAGCLPPVSQPKDDKEKGDAVGNEKGSDDVAYAREHGEGLDIPAGTVRTYMIGTSRCTHIYIYIYIYIYMHVYRCILNLLVCMYKLTNARKQRESLSDEPSPARDGGRDGSEGRGN